MTPGAARGTTWLGTIIPALPAEAPSPTGARHTTVTLRPARRSAYAAHSPTAPPPMTRMSVFMG